MSIFNDTTPPEAFEAVADKVADLAQRLMNGDHEQATLDIAAARLLTLEDVFRDEAKSRAEGKTLGVFEEKFRDLTSVQLNATAESIRRDIENPRNPGGKARIICYATLFFCLFKNAAKRAEEQEAKEAKEAQASKN